MIKSNHSSIRHEWENALEFRSYMLITLAITIKAIMIFILLLIKTTNSILINHASIQKTNQIFNQKFRTEVYFSTWN